MNTFKIAITGASGYIGSNLSNYLKNKGHVIYEMGRKFSEDGKKCIYFELGKSNDYRQLSGIDVLIHCAYDRSVKNDQENKKINFDGSVDLIRNAKQNNIKKIIFLSSMAAFDNAESNYGRIKYAIEKELEPLGAIIVRPGLVLHKDSQGIVGMINRVISKSRIIPMLKTEKMFFPCCMKDLELLVENILYYEKKINSPIIAASNCASSLEELVTVLAKSKNIKIISLYCPYKLLFIGLRLAEFFNIPLGFRSDHLKSMKYFNRNINFTMPIDMGVKFRSLDAAVRADEC